MAGLSGTNLGAILTLIVSLSSVITLAYRISQNLLILRIAFAWKLGLVAVAILPIQIACGFFRFHLQRTLSDTLRKAYANSADLACEQVAAIRTVASLNREPYVIQEFVQSLEQPIHEALMKTLKSTAVCIFSPSANRQLLAFSQSYQFFSLSLIFWFGSTLLESGEYTITQFFVAYIPVVSFF
jgi:ATP-binding cassette, subfamily B (MDR/TAP), member 1